MTSLDGFVWVLVLLWRSGSLSLHFQFAVEGFSCRFPGQQQGHVPRVPAMVVAADSLFSGDRGVLGLAVAVAAALDLAVVAGRGQRSWVRFGVFPGVFPAFSWAVQQLF